MKLVIRRDNKLIITSKQSEHQLDKLVDSIMEMNDASPMLPITLVMCRKTLLPPDAPISDLREVLARLADSFAKTADSE